MSRALLRPSGGSVGLLAETLAFCSQPLGGRPLLLSTRVVESVRGVPLRGKVFLRGFDKSCHSPPTENEETRASLYRQQRAPEKGAEQHSRETLYKRYLGNTSPYRNACLI